jgi:hypothetical protein
MPKIENIVSLVRLGLIDPRLMILAWKLRRSKRTYLSFSTLHSLAENFMSLQRYATQQLQVAEFGVGRGGSAMLLAWLVDKYRGHITLYDVFGRIPAPTDQDGDKAVSRYKTIVHQEGVDYYGNLTDLIEIVRHDIYTVCRPEYVDFVQGKYEEVLPQLNDGRKFSLVHIDCDWYESSTAVYRYLKNRMTPVAVIQVDDYSSWEGSKRAFQDAQWLNHYKTHLVDGALVINASIN